MTRQASESVDRRPLASRQRRVFQRLAASLAARRVPPNAISVSSIVLGIAAGVALIATSRSDDLWIRIFWLASAGLIQLRLLANMLDGMVAIESDRASPIGELYNEVPDRVSDSAILIGLGYAVGGLPVLGYAAAIIALFVAYIRAMGASIGAGQAFHGPMAKPHRMFVISVACVYCGISPSTWQPVDVETGMGVAAGALAVITVGGSVTAVRRLLFIASTVRNQDS